MATSPSTTARRSPRGRSSRSRRIRGSSRPISACGRRNGSSVPLLALDAVDTYYGQIHILQRLSIRVEQGELVCLLGGNASGKSTTLKTILGIVRPRNGRVLLAGEDVTR